MNLANRPSRAWTNISGATSPPLAGGPLYVPTLAVKKDGVAEFSAAVEKIAGPVTCRHAPLLEMRGISKRFPGVVALDGVDLQIAPGEVVAVVGENGAGKSTLMKILGGVYQPDAGEIRLDGRPIKIHDVNDAIPLGIAFIHQELNVLDNLDVAANVFLGREPRNALWLIDSKKNPRRHRTVSAPVGPAVSTRTRLDRCPWRTSRWWKSPRRSR